MTITYCCIISQYIYNCYILRNDENLFSVFVCADEKSKLERIMKRTHITSEKEAYQRMIKTDRNRARFYNYFSDHKWGAATTYDLCVKSSHLGVDKTVDTICSVIDNL